MMIITGPQLRAARRHAQRMGTQIGDMLDNDHDGDGGEHVEVLLNTWRMFIDQFQDPTTGDTVAAQHVAESFREGVSKTQSPGLKIILEV